MGPRSDNRFMPNAAAAAAQGGPVRGAPNITTLIPQLLRYRSHKIVRALEMLNRPVTKDGSSFVVNTKLGEVTVDGTVFKRDDKTPVAGDYLVVYDDSYVSWSPRAAFVGGYSIED